jgi:5'-nucleotidase
VNKIIVTNDDGVQAPGILALATALRRLGDVQVIGPALSQSASGHKKTLFQDIPVSEVALADGTRAMSVGGSPADCIALAALGMVDWPPSLVVSGINRGPNMGQDITYSGTVTAALEAAIQGFLATVKGIRLTRQGVRIYQDELEVNNNVYRIVGPPPGGQFEEEGTDIWAVHNGYASLTPIHLDLTAHRFLADLAAWDITV